MSVIILITLVCVILCAVYLHVAPISSEPDGSADRIINTVIPILLTALAIALALVLIPVQKTFFDTVVLMAGFAIFMLVVEVIAVFVLFGFISWVSLSMWQRAEQRKRKSQKTKVE